VFLEMMESSLCHLLAPYASGLGILSGKLSQREKEVAMMVKQGKLSKEIAQTLGVDVTTVNTQRNSIRKKLGLSKNRKLRLRDYLNAQPE
jgi:DNA-binding CsgD family transcriptional regulator